MVERLKRSNVESKQINVPAIRRNQDGTFVKGISGNVSGRPAIVKEVIELSRQHTAEAIERLVHLMRKGYPDAVKLAACEALLNRGYGKPHVSIAVAGASDAKARIKIVRQNVGTNNEITNVETTYTRAINSRD